jgi:hypothetical protein
MAEVTFLAETYEAISLIFFLRLVFTYMGGNKQLVNITILQFITTAIFPGNIIDFWNTF